MHVCEIGEVSVFTCNKGKREYEDQQISSVFTENDENLQSQGEKKHYSSTNSIRRERKGVCVCVYGKNDSAAGIKMRWPI